MGPSLILKSWGIWHFWVPVRNALGRTCVCMIVYSVQHTGDTRLALGKDDVMQAQGMALLREATLPPEAHDEVQSWLYNSQQTVRPLCEKAGQDQASWLSHSCLSGVCTSVASHWSSSKAATQDLKYSPGL